MKTAIRIDKNKIADICRRHHIQKLSLFGSVLRDDFGAESDVDVLVQYQPGQAIGFEVFDIEKELSALFGHQVDLVTEKYLNPRLRDLVLESAEVQYAEG
jgi:predicted nucleotidyltransferase